VSVPLPPVSAVLSIVTAALFLIMAVLHLLRVILGWPARIGGLDIPLWASWLALIVSSGLAYFGFRLSGGGH
jgi:hypothetical protein